MSYHRIIAQCFLDDMDMGGDVDLAAELVRAGYACAWPVFSGGAYRSWLRHRARDDQCCREPGRMIERFGIQHSRLYALLMSDTTMGGRLYRNNRERMVHLVLRRKGAQPEPPRVLGWTRPCGQGTIIAGISAEG